MLLATYTPGCFEEFVDLVVPELQRRRPFELLPGTHAEGEPARGVATVGSATLFCILYFSCMGGQWTLTDLQEGPRGR
jgi:hypothetical protein